MRARSPSRVSILCEQGPASWARVATGGLTSVELRIPRRGAPAPAVPAPGHLPLAVSVHGGIWVSDVRTRLAYRIDPATNRVVARRPIIVPNELTALGDDAGWAQNGPDGGWVLLRVDP